MAKAVLAMKKPQSVQPWTKPSVICPSYSPQPLVVSVGGKSWKKAESLAS